MVRRLSDLGEFGLIRRIDRLVRGSAGGEVALGIGDDAALLRLRPGEDLVASCDALVEGVHFRWSGQAARSVGRRALLVNLSDLAAMGARPLGCLLALCAPPSLPLPRADGLLRGLAAEARRRDCPLVGGNVAKDRHTTLTLTALGAVARGRALRRGRARSGDRLFVTGTLGAAALARARSEREGRPLRLLPPCRLEAGRALGRMRARVSCIDLSDGLVSDLGHLLEGTGLGADVDTARLPRSGGFERACRRLGLDSAVLLTRGGEDYELLFSLPPGAPGASTLGRRLGVRVTEIGRVSRRPGLRGLPRGSGWRHF